jgi:hypothetical protein
VTLISGHADGLRVLAHRLRSVLLVGVALVLGLAALPGHAQTKSLEWQRLDTDITVLPNGDLQIAETNVIDFTSGTFTFGFRDIDQSRLTGISDIVVTENDQPLETEIVTTEDGSLRIKYYFLTPARDEQRTFVLRYLVSGATRYYEGGDQVFWSAVYPERNGFPVLYARSTVRLSSGATATNAEVYGVQADGWVRALSSGRPSTPSRAATRWKSACSSRTASSAAVQRHGRRPSTNAASSRRRKGRASTWSPCSSRR